MTAMFFKVYGERNGAHYRVKRLFAIVGCGIVEIAVYRSETDKLQVKRSRWSHEARYRA